MSRCPVTATAGRPVPVVTVESLAKDGAVGVPSGRRWNYCAAPDCPVVYFTEEGDRIERSALAVRVGEKEPDAPHTVCYCFGHTVEEIREEVERTGASTVPASIAARVKAGECSCETKNPKGTCCLGDVNREVKAALVAASSQPSGLGPVAAVPQAGTHDCCAVPAERTGPRATGDRKGILAAGVAVLTAIASSACCWLPLLLIAVGGSAAGVAATFERFRPVFLVVAPIFLGVGFYLLYLRKPACGPDGACAAPNPRLRRASRVMLWIATVLVAGFALFPSYVGALLGDGGATAQEDVVGPTRTVSLRITGMTCEACAVRLQHDLSNVRGVRRATVSYDEGRATLLVEPDAAADAVPRLIEAVERAGYEAQVESSALPGGGG